jgi:hypothetical protein
VVGGTGLEPVTSSVWSAGPSLRYRRPGSASRATRGHQRPASEAQPRVIRRHGEDACHHCQNENSHDDALRDRGDAPPPRVSPTLARNHEEHKDAANHEDPGCETNKGDEFVDDHSDDQRRMRGSQDVGPPCLGSRSSARTSKATRKIVNTVSG